MRRRTKVVSGILALIVGFGTAGVGARAAVHATRAHETSANLLRVTAGLLGQSQFARRPLDGELAARFLDGYLDELDPNHSLFLQSDLAEFARYRPTLAAATREAGDSRPALAIFERYLERLEQRVAYVGTLLRSDKFDFSGHDAYSFDREHAPRPVNLAAARALWREELRAEFLEAELTDEPVERVRTSLTHEFEQKLALAKALRTDEVLEIYLNALAHVYDPHSDYLGRAQMDGLAIDMNLALFGIGASLETEHGQCQIRELLPGGPAARSGKLRAGDRILAVGQGNGALVDVTGLPLSRTVELIRGPKGSKVALSVEHAGAADASPPENISLVRDEVALEDQRAKARIVDLREGGAETLRVGVVELPSFYAGMGGQTGVEQPSATADVAALLRKLEAENVRGVVLDLRGNGGGSLREAIDLTGLFIGHGPVVQTRGPTGDLEVDTDPDPAVVYAGPLVVLTSRTSASASEILAGALEDYGRAVVVGDTSTFGKGTVQSIVPLAPIMDGAGLSHSYDPGALKLTIRKFYRPNGASTQLRGVASDIVLPSPTNFGTTSEAALKDPLPWDAVPAAPHERWNRVEPYVVELRRRSAARVAADKDFALLTEDAARFAQSLAKKSVSLNEAERRHELAEAKTRASAYEAEARALRAAAPPTYELTVKNAALPGLPPPAVASSDTHRRRRSPAEDIELTESERILADYVELLGQPSAT